MKRYAFRFSANGRLFILLVLLGWFATFSTLVESSGLYNLSQPVVSSVSRGSVDMSPALEFSTGYLSAGSPAASGSAEPFGGIASFPALQSATCATPPSNMVSWYRAEGNSSDQQGRNYGRLKNGAGFAHGTVGLAFDLDGNDDYVDIGDLAQLDNASELTVIAWVKRENTGPSVAGIIGKFDTGGSPGNSFLFYLGEGDVQNRGLLVVALDDNINFAGVQGRTEIPFDQWTFVAATWRNSDGQLKIYKNGIEDGSGTAGMGRTMKTHRAYPAKIGEWGVLRDSRYKFPGQIDEPAIFNRALSASEIQAIFNAGSAGMCVPVCTPAPANQVSWYRSEDNANDSAGTNNGSLQNGATFAMGQVGQGFNFDGVDDYVMVGNPPALNFGTRDFSVQAWVKTSFLGGSFNDYIISKSDVGNDAQFVLSYNAGGTGFPSFLMSDGTTISLASGTANLADGTFHHLAGVREGTTLRMYVDGVHVGTATTRSLVNATSANNVVIGGRERYEFDPYFKGIIDEVQFYSRALSAAEIGAIFRAGTAGQCSSCAPAPANQVSSYKAENNANDSFGTNNGELLNGATFAPGKVGQAFSFDGVDAMVNVPFSSVLNVASAVTIEAWVRTTSTVTSDHKLLAGRPGNYQLAKVDNGRVAFAVVIGGNFINAFSAATLAPNTLTHVAGTYDASTGLVKVYVDGSLAGTTVTSGIPDTGTQPFQIGGFGGSFVSNQFINNFGGEIDEVSLYNRALSASEIQSIFDADSAGMCGPTLQISPTSTTVNTGGTVNFKASGGTPPHTFSLFANNSIAAIDFSSGVYTAGTLVGIDTVRVTDALGSTSDATVNVSAGAPARLAFLVQPTNTAGNATIAPVVQVAIVDQFGNIVRNAINAVTVSIANNPAGGVLSGRLIVDNPDNGIAFFGDLHIDAVGNGYTLVASSSGLTPSTSNTFSITGPTQLAFTVQPSNAAVNATIAPVVQVAILDQLGNIVRNATNTVTMSIANNPAGGVLSGRLIVDNPDNGIAFFGNLSIDGIGNGYTLVATASGLTSATSTSFSIIGPTQLAFTVQPSNTPPNTNIAPVVQIAILDQFGNIVRNATNTVTIAIGTNPTGGVLSGRQIVDNPDNGIAFFGNLQIDAIGNGYTLVATSGVLTPAISSAFNIERSFVVTNTDDSGPGSLRQAIINSNDTPDRQTISFSITTGTAPFTIAPTTNLPTITDAIIIDGTTQPGYTGSPIVELSGANNSSDNGLEISAGNSTVKGLVINRFTHAIILLSGSNTIQGNYIGTDVTGNIGRGNGFAIEISNSIGNQIGGATPAARNVISGNAVGVGITSALSNGNVIQGNFIGTNASGTAALGNSVSGIQLSGTNSNIGGMTPGEGNVISGNVNGITLCGSGHNIQGNFIGTDPTGTAGIPNVLGIILGSQGASNITIGGAPGGVGNVIAFNTQGVRLITNGNGISIRANSIHTNALMGIDLGAGDVNPNDPLDPDTGVNNLQNYPVLNSVVTNGSNTIIQGSLNSTPTSAFTLDFYSNPVCDYGEGRTYLGSSNLSTNVTGIASFNANLPVATTIGHRITATATDSQGNTSEFSQCRVIAQALVTISGRLTDSNNAPLANAVVGLSGGQTLTRITDSKGRYSFVSLPTGENYKVTPSTPNYVFTPPIRPYSNLLTNQQNQDFTSTNNKFVLSGQLMLQTNNGLLPLSGVTMSLVGTAARTTNASGVYVFTGLNPGSYSMTPSKPGYSFSPSSVDLTISNSHQQRNFLAFVTGTPLEGQIFFGTTDGMIGRINADGSGLNVLSRSPNLSIRHNETEPSISRDATRIVYRDLFFMRSIRTVSSELLEDTVLELASYRNEDIRAPVFSPDGTKILFSRYTPHFPDWLYQISIINAGGGTEATIKFNSPTQPTSPTWLSNTRVAFSAWDGHDTELFAINLDATGLVQLTNNEVFDFDPVASPDGLKIAFRRTAASINEASRLVVRNATPGGVETEISNSIDYDSRAAWSPDGTRVAFVKYTLTDNKLKTFAVDASDGSGLRVIFDGSGVFGPWTNPAMPPSLSWGPVRTFPTAPGANVTVQADGASVVFGGVATSGTTTFIPITPTAAGTAPNGFVLGSQAYEISTTATYSAPLTVCLIVDQSISDTQFAALSLMHNEGGVLVDRTTSRDLATRKICGTVTTLSPFVLAEQIDDAKPSITGLVQDSSGNPLSDLFVQLTGAETRTVQTDAFGIFQFVNLIEGGNYNVRPKQTGYLFTEYSQDFVNLSGEETAIFTGTQTTFSVSGKALDENANGISGVAISLGSSTTNPVITDSNGNYTLTGLLADGFVSIIPSKSGFFFTPPQVGIESLTGNLSDINFVAGPPPANQSPFAASDVAAANQNTAVIVAVLANDADPDGDPLTVTSTTQGSNGSVTINANNTVTYSPNTGFTGTDNFTYTISDGRGGSASAAVTVTVSQGNRPPTAVCQNLTSSAAANCQAAVTAQQVGGFSSDPDGDAITMTIFPAGPFNVGAHLVTLTLTDSRGASASCNATLTVVDNTPPAINCPSNIVAAASPNQCSAGVNYSVNATDNCSSATVTCTPPSGSSFNSGTTTVACVATDAGGNTTNCSFTVTIPSNQPVLLTCPANLHLTVPSGQTSAVVNFTPITTGGCGAVALVATPPSGSTFPLGTTTVNVVATSAGTPTTCSFTVTVNGATTQPAKIAFDTTRDGNPEIYSMNADGSNPSRLTFNSALDVGPAWSPDLSKIAFTSARTGNGDIYVMNADGTNQTRLTSTSAIEGDPSWSPDGTKIAFWSSRDGDAEIYVMNADGTNQTRTTSHSRSDTQPQWSPDGTKLVFVSNRNSLLNFDIYVMHADGSQVIRLTTTASIDESPDWSPDGSKIVFTSNRSNLLDFEIWVMNANGSGQSRLTTTTRSSVRPSWSRDGSQITFATNRHGLLNFEIYTMNANGSSQTRLTTSSAVDFNPDR